MEDAKNLEMNAKPQEGRALRAGWRVKRGHGTVWHKDSCLHDYVVVGEKIYGPDVVIEMPDSTEEERLKKALDLWGVPPLAAKSPETIVSTFELENLGATDAAVRRAAKAGGMKNSETAAGWDCAAFLVYEIAEHEKKQKKMEELRSWLAAQVNNLDGQRQEALRLGMGVHAEHCRDIRDTYLTALVKMGELGL